MDWRWQSDEEQHELIIDFAREAHVWGHLNYYVYVKNVNSDNLVRLYIEFEEEKTSDSESNDEGHSNRTVSTAKKSKTLRQSTTKEMA